MRRVVGRRRVERISRGGRVQVGRRKVMGGGTGAVRVGRMRGTRAVGGEGGVGRPSSRGEQHRMEDDRESRGRRGAMEKSTRAAEAGVDRRRVRTVSMRGSAAQRRWLRNMRRHLRPAVASSSPPRHARRREEREGRRWKLKTPGEQWRCQGVEAEGSGVEVEGGGGEGRGKWQRDVGLHIACPVSCGLPSTLGDGVSNDERRAATVPCS